MTRCDSGGYLQSKLFLLWIFFFSFLCSLVNCGCTCAAGFCIRKERRLPVQQEPALSALLPAAAGAGWPADPHVPILIPAAAEPSGVLCANPDSPQPPPKPSRAQRCAGSMAGALGEVVPRLPASVPAEAASPGRPPRPRGDAWQR